MSNLKAYYLPKAGGVVNVINPPGYQGEDVAAFLATLRPVFQWLCADLNGQRIWTNPNANADDLADAA